MASWNAQRSSLRRSSEQHRMCRTSTRITSMWSKWTNHISIRQSRAPLRARAVPSRIMCGSGEQPSPECRSASSFECCDTQTTRLRGVLVAKKRSWLAYGFWKSPVKLSWSQMGGRRPSLPWSSSRKKKAGVMQTFGMRWWTILPGRSSIRTGSPPTTSRTGGALWSVGFASAWADAFRFTQTERSEPGFWMNFIGARSWRMATAWTGAIRGMCRWQRLWPRCDHIPWPWDAASEEMCPYAAPCLSAPFAFM